MSSPQHETTVESWPAQRDALRTRYPKASDGILFCLFKLEQDPSLTIPDFRGEASRLGIGLGGRALHSAKVLLGLAKPAGRKKANALPALAPKRPRPSVAAAAANGAVQDLETRLIRTMTEIQQAATAESVRLRQALQRALEILQDALDEE